MLKPLSEFVLLSYPRSGSNFVWSILNELLPGICLYKSHAATLRFWTSFTPASYIGEGWLMPDRESTAPMYLAHLPTIFVLRDYKECIARQTLTYVFDDTFKNQLLNKFPSGNERAEHHYDYIRVLEHFDQLTMPKILIRYEELFSNTSNSINDLSTFLRANGVSQLEDVPPDIAPKSLERYARITTPSMSGGTNLLYHQSKMTRGTISSIDKFVFSEYPYLAEKYLSPYRK